MEGAGDNGNGAGKKLLIEVGGHTVEHNKLLGHLFAADGNADLSVPVALVGKQAAYSLRGTAVGGDAVAGLGGVDDEVAGLESFEGVGDGAG